MGLSLLIPTTDRPKRLSRLLQFLIKHLPRLGIDVPIEIIVADGSNEVSINHFLSNFSDLCKSSSNLDFKYYHLPGSTFFQRLCVLAVLSTYEIIQYVGDEDFPIYSELQSHLSEFGLNQSLVAIAGAYINIERHADNIILTSAERPYSGISIDFADPTARIIQYCTLDSIGCASLFYSLQRKRYVQDFFHHLATSNANYYYGGVEFMHKVHCLTAGSIMLPSKTTLIRDQLYHHYEVENQRQAPSDDKYPYFGAKAVDYCIQRLSSFCNLDLDIARDTIAKVIINTEGVSYSRESARRHLYVSRNDIDQNAYADFVDVFSSTFSTIYSSTSTSG